MLRHSLPPVAFCCQASTAEEEAKLGVQEFADKYFCGPLYLDEERKLYDALGSRTLSIPFGKMIFNPITTYREFKALGERTKAKVRTRHG